jgi:Gluconate 2-dehydrogenase subunit 3/TAT (twin-arginine translocation) pathway signal sequence
MEDNDLTRRDVLKLGAAAAAAGVLSTSTPLAAQTAATVTFFTPGELKLVDELSEMIIPADEHSPGARAAKVAAYIDARLAEAFDEADRTRWREGLKRIDDLSRTASGKSFLESTPDQRVALLTEMSKNEATPKRPEEVFFKDLKSRVVFAYYTSDIGIHRDIEYKGNTFLPEFVGYDVSQEKR